MKILFIVPGDREQASTRLRVLNLVPELADSSHTLDVISLSEAPSEYTSNETVKRFVFAANILKRVGTYDIVYVHRLPFPPAFLKLLTRLSETLVYDFDDALYATPPWQPDTEADDTRLHAMLAESSLVIAGSPVLAEYAEDFSDNVRVIPTPLPRKKYEPYWDRTDTGDTDVTISWVGNPQNLYYLQQFSDPIEAVLDDFPHVSLDVITAAEHEHSPLVDRDDVAYKTWSLNRELEYISDSEIAIRPLTDDEWTRGKGGFTSVVQAMALELPVVVTPVSYLGEIVEDGTSGFHATTDSDWEPSLRRLITNPDERLQMGRNARIRVDELNFWTADRAAELSEILQDVRRRND